MSVIIALETSSAIASVALRHPGALDMLETGGVQTHSQTVLPMLQQLLRQAGLTLSDCDAIAFGAGPGSFTGVRTACGIAQGLGFGADRPVIAISTLEAMAESCHRLTGASAVLTVLDARMGEVYWAQYRFAPDLQIEIEPRLSAPDGVVPVGEVIACGNGLSACARQFSGQPFMQDAHPELMPHAAQIATLAQVALRTGRQVAARDAQPIYLRNNVALTSAERLQKSRQAAA